MLYKIFLLDFLEIILYYTLLVTDWKPEIGFWQGEVRAPLWKIIKYAKKLAKNEEKPCSTLP